MPGSGRSPSTFLHSRKNHRRARGLLRLLGWGARIRTWDGGTKTRCLTAWLRPKASGRAGGESGRAVIAMIGRTGNNPAQPRLQAPRHDTLCGSGKLLTIHTMYWQTNNVPAKGRYINE